MSLGIMEERLHAVEAGLAAGEAVAHGELKDRQNWELLGKRVAERDDLKRSLVKAPDNLEDEVRRALFSHPMSSAGAMGEGAKYAGGNPAARIKTWRQVVARRGTGIIGRKSMCSPSKRLRPARRSGEVPR